MKNKIVLYGLLTLIGLAIIATMFTSVPQQIRQALPTATLNYYVANYGNDSNPGTITLPWLTLRKAIRTVNAGSTVYIRAGSYDAASTSTAGGSQGFLNSGTESSPITITNYPGEAVTIHQNGKNAFSCWWTEAGGAQYGYNKINYIRIIGTAVSPRLINGISSKKGIVIQGENVAHNYPITAFGCDHWEIAGIDFFDVAAGIRTWKQNYSEMVDNSSDYWYVHDNRVYSYSGESGFQFDGNNNTIVNNEVYKTLNVINTPYGCSSINLCGNNNVVRGNILSRNGSDERCFAMIFEWDLSDNNLIENNQMLDFDETAIYFAGGDNNTIQNNVIMARNSTGSAFSIESENGNTKKDWPCNDYPGSGSTSEELLPPNNPGHYDYNYYFPHDCRSKNNKVLNNAIVGWGHISMIWGGYTETSTIFQGNTTTLPIGTPATITPIVMTSTPTITATFLPTYTPSRTPTIKPTATYTLIPSA
jgi:parallel beta-helix repeat protein